MFKYLLQGILFGFAYVAPIGAQNLYVINAAARKSKMEAYQVSLITVFFDISLAISCFWGIGLLIDKFLIIKFIMLLLGCVAVIYIGAGLIQSSTKISTEGKIDNSLINIIISCFAVTWLNPQAIIDGSLILGGFHASLPSAMSIYFISGVCIASFVWFNSLVTFVIKFRSKFNNMIKWINIICGAVLVLYGLKLGYSFVQLLMNK